ncbi:hypothetical protein VTN02DRAFT_5901 [Thermoascus thermophilus]
MCILSQPGQTQRKIVEGIEDSTPNPGQKSIVLHMLELTPISSIDSAILEAMETYEVKIKGKAFGVKGIRSITDHSKQYRVHAKKAVPFVEIWDQMK